MIFLLALLCAPAFGQEAWMAEVLGPYDGPVLNAGRIEHLSTMFRLDEAGHLVGHYRVEDIPPFEGDLTDFRPDGDQQGTFVWHDPFGEGVVHIRFEPGNARFLGRWGLTQPLPDNVFNGFRARAPATS